MPLRVKVYMCRDNIGEELTRSVALLTLLPVSKFVLCLVSPAPPARLTHTQLLVLRPPRSDALLCFCVDLSRLFVFSFVLFSFIFLFSLERERVVITHLSRVNSAQIPFFCRLDRNSKVKTEQSSPTNSKYSHSLFIRPTLFPNNQPSPANRKCCLFLVFHQSSFAVLPLWVSFQVQNKSKGDKSKNNLAAIETSSANNI